MLTVFGGVVSWAAKRWIFDLAPDRQKICFSFISKDLVGPSFFEIPGLEIYVHGAKQSLVSVTYLCIWNAGSKVVRQSDWAPTDPLTVVVTAGSLLSFEIVAQTRPACNVLIHRSEISSNLPASFDFLGKRDGIVLRLVHTGAASEAKFALNGILIDGDEVEFVKPEPLIARSSQKSEETGSIWINLLAYTLVAFGLSAICLLLFVLVSKQSLWNDLGVSMIFGFGFASVAFLMNFLEVWLVRKRPRLPPILRDSLLGIAPEKSTVPH